MTDREENSIHAETRGYSEVDNDFIPSDARPLCPNCLRPCERLQFYCENCDSNEAINPLASYMPFVRIRFNTGMLCKVWRKLWADKGVSILGRVFFVFILLWRAKILLIVGLPLTLIYRIEAPQIRRSLVIGFWVLFFGLLSAFIILALIVY